MLEAPQMTAIVIFMGSQEKGARCQMPLALAQAGPAARVPAPIRPLAFPPIKRHNRQPIQPKQAGHETLPYPEERLNYVLLYRLNQPHCRSWTVHDMFL